MEVGLHPLLAVYTSDLNKTIGKVGTDIFASFGAEQLKLVKLCGPQHVDKNGIHNILTDARVLVFGIYVSILLLPCLWAGCLGLDVEKMMPTNEDLHSPLFYGSASLQPPPHQQKEGGNVTPHF